MEKKEAIQYLERKGKIEGTQEEVKYSKKEKEEIKKVMKEGKIYGDPIAEIQW